jgi:hypothetical protein
MSMRDNIAIEIANGNIPDTFSTIELLQNPQGDKYKIGHNLYKEVSISTNLNNLSIGPYDREGNHVKTGRKPEYIKHSKDRFSLFKGIYRRNSNQAPETVNTPTPTATVTSVNNPIENKQMPPLNFGSETSMLSKNDIYNSFVDYIENKPFRLFSYVEKGKWYPTDRAVVSWKNRLEAYRWGTQDWMETEKHLKSFTSQLNALITHNFTNTQDALEIYASIKKWGGITKVDSVTPSDVIDNLRKIHEYTRSGISTPSPINSTWTKVYALAFPESFVIYDTRVAYAIVSIAEDIYRPSRSEGSHPEDNIKKFHRVFDAIGTMHTAARGGTRPRGVRYKSWPKAYQSWEAQLQANELCIGICNSLNSKKIGDRVNWSLREVEAVLFMEGY